MAKDRNSRFQNVKSGSFSVGCLVVSSRRSMQKENEKRAEI
jgi:hypothetical protein